MRTSSEIETISKRASRAAGYTWGVSEEVGKCIKSLELYQISGLENLNEYLKKMGEIRKFTRKGLGNFTYKKYLMCFDQKLVYCLRYTSKSLFQKIDSNKVTQEINLSA